MAAVNGVGLFKWLCIESADSDLSSLVKVMPVTRGFHINKLLRAKSDLLVAMADPHLLKYDSTHGYRGYFETQGMTQVYDVC